MVCDHLRRFSAGIGALHDLGVESETEGVSRYGTNYWWAEYHRGTLLWRLGRYAGAAEITTRVREQAPGTGLAVGALHRLGAIDQALGNLAEAEEKFLQCLRERGESPWNHRRAYSYRRLGQVYAQTGRVKKAAEAFREALAISSRCGDWRYVAETEADILEFLVLTQAEGDCPKLESVLEEAARFGLDDKSVSRGFRELARRGHGYLEVVDPRTAKTTGEVVSFQRAHEKGYWHATVTVLIADAAGEVALQKRLEKSSQGKWDASVTGHVDIGESDVEAAVRETREELWLDVSPDRLVGIGPPRRFKKCGKPRVAKDRHESRFSYVYSRAGKNNERVSLFALRLSDEETKRERARDEEDRPPIRWLSLRQVEREVNRDPARFASGLKQLLHPEILRRIRKRLGIAER